MITNFWLFLLTYNVFFALHGIGSFDQENDGTPDSTFLVVQNEFERHRDDDGRNYNREMVRFKRNPQAGGTPSIFKAVSDLDLLEVKLYVELRNVSVKCVNRDYRTPAHIAAYKGNLTILEYLVNADESVLEMTDGFGETILHVAAEKGPLEMVKFLVDGHNMDIYGRTKIFPSNTPLHLAAFRGSLDIVKYFVDDKQMDPSILNDLEEPPVFQAAKLARLDVIKYLYEKHKVDLHTVDGQNKNILHLCALTANLTLAKYLLDEKKLTFDVNQRDNLGYTVLIWGARRNRTDFIEYFVEEKHADVNIQDNEGRTMLHHAVDHSNLRLIEYLYHHGAKFDIRDNKGNTPRDVTSDPTLQNFTDTLIQSTLNPQTPITD